MAVSCVSIGARWEVRLFGGVVARNGDLVVDRFPSRAVAVLLARLATAGRPVSRVGLVALLWPDVDDESVGLNRLRQALSKLRSLLEPVGVVPNSVLCADRLRIWLNPATYECDAVQFERLVAAGQPRAARDLYRGEFMPGHFVEWVLEERDRHLSVFEALASGSPPTPNSDVGRSVKFPKLSNPSDPVDRRLLLNYTTTFLGRDDEVSALERLLADHRLVTVSGSGGCGKSRLCAEIARRVDRFETVVFVSLSDCESAQQALHQIRAALNLQAGDDHPLRQIVSCLAEHSALLILDNFDQLIGESGDGMLTDLLAGLPRLRVLLTSRSPSRREDEAELVLSPLVLPRVDSSLPAVAINPAVRLFCDRARIARAEFHLHPRNWLEVAELCVALDGLPLAIELAASRIRSHSPKDILHELSNGLAVLSRRDVTSTRVPRHASLAATIEWSWCRLDVALQRLMSDLAAFRGAWTIESARAVTGDRHCSRHIDTLVTASLITLDSASEPSRFRMLGSVREFVRERAAPGQVLASRRRHRSHFLQLAAQPEAAHRGLDPGELSNVTEALKSSLVDHDLEVAVRLSRAMTEQWVTQGVDPEALDALQQLLSSDLVAEDQCRLAILLARLLVKTGRFEAAVSLALRATELVACDIELQAEALLTLTNVRWLWTRSAGEVTMEAEQALQLAERSASPALRARARLLLAAIWLSGNANLTDVQRLFDEAEELFASGGDARGAMAAWPGKAMCLIQAGRQREAIDFSLGRLLDAAHMNQVEIQLLLLNRLSLAYETCREFNHVIDTCRQQLRLARKHGMKYHIAYALWNQCRPLARIRHPRAAVLSAAAQAYWQRHFGPLDAADLRQLERVRRLITVSEASASVADQWARGLALPERTALDWACDS